MRPSPRVYLDENVHPAIGEALRKRGFTVLTARTAGLLGAGDEQQLAYAAARDSIILSHNRKHFRRWHEIFLKHGRPHAGVALLPQETAVEIRQLRASMLLDWISTHSDHRSQLFTWGELQARIEKGYRPPGYTEDDIRLALGR